MSTYIFISQKRHDPSASTREEHNWRQLKNYKIDEEEDACYPSKVAGFAGSEQAVTWKTREKAEQLIAAE